MLITAWVSLKRFAVLIPGIVVAYISVRDIFPYFHHRHLPVAVAVLITYILGAYLLVPAIMRTWRMFVPAHHLPLYCITPDGFASDPLNIGIIGSRQQLIEAMVDRGWHVARPLTPDSIMGTILAIIFKRPYHGTPMSSLYLFGRKQDVGFEKQLVEHGRGHRHHVRFWATTLDDIQGLDEKKVQSRSRQEQLIADKMLWVGAASRDVGVTFTKHNLQFTHAVAPNTNRERELIATELEEAKLATLVTTIRLHHQSYRLINRAWSRALLTDGKMAILRLKK